MPVSKPAFPRSQSWLDGMVDTINSAESAASAAAAAAAANTTAVAERPTTEQVAESITTALGPYATDAELTAALSSSAPLILGASDPLPAGTGPNRLVIRLAQATVSLLKRYGKNATALTDTATVTTATVPSGDQAFGTVNGTVSWSQAKGGLVFAAGTTARNVRWSDLSGATLTMGAAFRFGDSGSSWGTATPGSGAPFVYGLGDAWRITLSNTGQFQVRNNTATTISTMSAPLTPGAWYYVAVTHVDGGSTSTITVELFDANGTVVFSVPATSTGTTVASQTGVIFGQQSSSTLGLELVMRQFAVAATTNRASVRTASAA